VREKLFALALISIVSLSAQGSPERPVSLQEAIREALANNLDLSVEKLNVPVAEGEGLITVHEVDVV
jgi:hypothetical protein